MAIAHVGDAGTATSKTSGTTVTLTVTATIEANNVAVVWFSGDNITTTTGDTTHLTCSDSAGNTWTKIREHTYSEGAVADGIMGALFYSRLSSQLTSGAGTITVTSNTSLTAKVISVKEYTVGANLNTEQIQVSAVDETVGNPPPSLALTGMTSRSYLLLRLDASEDNGDGTYAQDADYTSITATNTTGGALNTNATINGGWRIATLTADTCAPTTGESRDRVAILAALYETSATIEAIVPATINSASAVTATVTEVTTGGFQHLNSAIAASGTLHQVTGTISANSVAVLSVANVASPPASGTVTDSSGKSWVLMRSEVLGSRRLSCYYAVFNTGAAITVSVNFAASQACALSLEQNTAGHLTVPIVQSVSGSG